MKNNNLLWESLSEEEQCYCLHVNNRYIILYDLLKNPEKVKFIKGDNIQIVLHCMATMHDYDFGWLSKVYEIYPDLNYIENIVAFLRIRPWDYNKKSDNCSKEFFDYMVENITEILLTPTMITRFMGYFQDFLTKGTIVEMDSNLPQNFLFRPIFYNRIRDYFGDGFVEQIEFINTLES